MLALILTRIVSSDSIIRRVKSVKINKLTFQGVKLWGLCKVIGYATMVVSLIIVQLIMQCLCQREDRNRSEVQCLYKLVVQFDILLNYYSVCYPTNYCSFLFILWNAELMTKGQVLRV